MQQPENTIVYRMEVVEREVANLKQQLDRYVPVRENELQLKSIRDTVERIERDVGEAKKQLGEMNTKLQTADRETQARDQQQRENLAALQIKVLATVVTTVIGGLVAILVGYITHVFR